MRHGMRATRHFAPRLRMLPAAATRHTDATYATPFLSLFIFRLLRVILAGDAHICHADTLMPRR